MQEIDQLKKTNADLLVALQQAARLMRAAGFAMTGTATSQIIAAINAAAVCTVPPPGWQCTRAAGHDGPCAAQPSGWKVLSDDDKIDSARLVDVVQKNGCTLYRQDYWATDWTAVADWRYSAMPTDTAPAANAEGLTTLLQAAGAMRLVRCHDGSGEPFAAYDKDIADRVVADLRAEMHAMTDTRAPAADAPRLQPDITTLRFLTDVTTAAGLLAHGKRDKGLAERIGKASFDLRAALFSDKAPAVGAAALDVLAERRRQVEQEGWTPEHDDAYQYGELGRAAACYAAHKPFDDRGNMNWPWPAQWWKPGTARRNLVKAAALILADIERIDRASAKGAAGQEGGAA